MTEEFTMVQKARPDIARHCVGFRRFGYWYDAEGRSITAARNSYDEGVVELAQAKIGDMFALFAIPRKERQKLLPNQKFSYKAGRNDADAV